MTPFLKEIHQLKEESYKMVEWLSLKPVYGKCFVSIAPKRNCFYISSKAIKELGAPTHVKVGIEREKDRLVFKGLYEEKEKARGLNPEPSGNSKKLFSKALITHLKDEGYLEGEKTKRFNAEMESDLLKVDLKGADD